MSKEDEVREASTRFYTALNQMAKGDAGSMANVWSRSADVTTMHPIGGREVGWESVRGPWEQVAGLASGGQVKLSDQLIRVSGDIAYEVGVEQGNLSLGGKKIDIEHRVTNIYRHENGSWKIVHHHTDLSPAMVDVLKQLQAKR
jgi:ketosteroid isomerase-like protein